MMSNSLDLIMGTIQRLLQGPPSSIGGSMPGQDSHLDMLIFSQLKSTQRLLEDFSKELVLDWHGLIYEELYRVVTRISTLVRYPGDVSIPAEARGEHFLEALLDLRWWTWVVAFQAKTLLTNPTLHDIYFSRFDGVSETKSSSLSFDGKSVSRRLPSYSFELGQQGTERFWRGILQLISEDNKMRDVGKKEFEVLLTDIRNAQSGFDIKQLGPTKFRDARKPSSIGDYLPIDLTQDLLGASSTGYVIRTTFPDGKGGSYSCALKRIATMDEEPPDLAGLWHPHVVQLIHHWREKCGLHGEVRGWMPKSTFMTFLVMELMDGDLAKMMTSCKKPGVAPFSLLVAVDVMLQIAKGMLYLHEMGVCHPHLKCDNILCRVEKKTNAGIQAGFIVKLGGFRCSRMANDDTKKRDVFCFGLTCLEILTGDDWSEDIYGADKVPNAIIPESTPPILKYCIASCLDRNLTFSEVVMLLLLAQCQIMQTCKDEGMLYSGNLHIKSTKTNNRDLASSSTSKGGLHEMFHVHQLHPQLGEGPPSVQITLIFFHGFPKVLEEWRMTWMTRDNKLVWPQKWLPEDLDGDIRVLSVSFDDHLNMISKQKIKDLLQSLVLSATWKLGGTEQASILVGHSFGGVIIKALVIEAKSLVEKAVQKRSDREKVMLCKKFLKSIASVVFYSVPNALTNTEFENYISGCSNTRVLQRSSLLKSLRGDSFFISEMIRLSRDFESVVPRQTKVLAFLEGKPMSKKCFLVTEQSCEGKSLSWEWHKVDKDNHFEVCRPDSKSHIGYQILLNHLKQYMFSPPNINVDESPLMNDLITKISSQQIKVHRDAAKQIRHLTGMNKENRNRVPEQGGIAFLIHHLRSPDKMTQEHAITVLMNLSLEENVRGLIMIWAEAIDSIVHVLKFGHSMEARKKAAAAIQCLSDDHDVKISIGNRGAFPALVELLHGVGTCQGKKDVASAIWNLVCININIRRAVETDLISVLVDILNDDSTHELDILNDILLSILANLSSYRDGLIGIANTNPTSMLILYITFGSHKEKELATSLLCSLCLDDSSFIDAAYQFGASNPLVALLRDDQATDRCKQKATQLRYLLRSSRAHVKKPPRKEEEPRSLFGAGLNRGALGPLEALLRDDQATDRGKQKATQLRNLSKTHVKKPPPKEEEKLRSVVGASVKKPSRKEEQEQEQEQLRSVVGAIVNRESIYSRPHSKVQRTVRENTRTIPSF